MNECEKCGCPFFERNEDSSMSCINCHTISSESTITKGEENHV